MEINEKIDKLRTGLSKLFPGLEAQVLKFGTLSQGLDNFQELYTYVLQRNSSLINSSYFYNKKSLVHFTNGLSLNSILQERSIRLYNLNNLNDPREFTFASKILHVNETMIEDAKNNVFVISFCEPEILKNSTYEFNMWRLYGQNGRGFAILFSIYNDPKKWMDFHMSKVFYGSEHRDVFNRLQKLIYELNQTPPIVSIDLGKLLPFHKSKLFSLEKEVRIIHDRMQKRSGSSSQIWSDYYEPLFPKKRFDLQKLIDKKPNIQYLKVPIFHIGNEDYNAEIPILKIERIILGYNYLDEESHDLIKCIKDLCEDQIGYVPEIKHTRLRKYYLNIQKK